jgi:ATP/ADP translocase
MESFPDLGVWIAIVAPLAILQLGLMFFALVDLIRRDETQLRHLPKWGWVVIVVVVNLIGPILYLLIGREEA